MEQIIICMFVMRKNKTKRLRKKQKQEEGQKRHCSQNPSLFISVLPFILVFISVITLSFTSLPLSRSEPRPLFFGITSSRSLFFISPFPFSQRFSISFRFYAFFLVFFLFHSDFYWNLIFLCNCFYCSCCC